jgi:hypothetical protein
MSETNALAISFFICGPGVIRPSPSVDCAGPAIRRRPAAG